jgi:hypothetical protein
MDDDSLNILNPNAPSLRRSAVYTRATCVPIQRAATRMR